MWDVVALGCGAGCAPTFSLSRSTIFRCRADSVSSICWSHWAQTEGPGGREPRVTPRSAEPASPAPGRWPGAAARPSCSSLGREGSAPVGVRAGRASWAHVPTVQARPGPHLSAPPGVQGACPHTPPGEERCQEACAPRSWPLNSYLGAQPSTPCWRPVGRGARCRPTSGFWLQVGRGWGGTSGRWVVLGAEKRRAGGPGGRPPEEGRGRANGGRPGNGTWLPSRVGFGQKRGRCPTARVVPQGPRGLRPAWEGPAPGVTGSLSEFL